MCTSSSPITMTCRWSRSPFVFTCVSCDELINFLQDIEFTIQEGVLYMLQTRSGKRVGPASVKIALDLVKEGLATKDQAILTVKPEHLKQLLHPQFADVNGEGYKKNVAAMGLPASPGNSFSVLIVKTLSNQIVFRCGCGSHCIHSRRCGECSQSRRILHSRPR